MKRRLLASAILLGGLLSVQASDLTAVYLEGLVEISDGDVWKSLEIGDVVADTALIRVGENGFLELSMGDETINLLKPGIFDLGEMIRARMTVVTWNLDNLMGSKLKRLVKGGERHATAAAAGARGDAAEQEDLQWVEEGDEYLQEGLILIAQGDFAEAAELFHEGAEFALDSERAQEYLFYAAFALSESGDSGRALRLLREVNPSPRALYYDNHVLLKGRLLMESLDFSSALGLFEKYLERAVPDVSVQMVYIMAAYCHYWLGDEELALQDLSSAHAINPRSEPGRQAFQMMTERQ